MRKVCIFFLLSIIISLAAVGFVGTLNTKAQADTSEFLRIHIRADSNEESAQAVKYKVRDSVVEYLTPIIASCENKQDALTCVKKCLNGVENVATGVLKANGFDYGASAEICVENFPSRVYDGVELPQGEYSALIVRLGSGNGDNWWCVVYPPLCFASPTGENVVYKSKIVEIIQRWKEKKGVACTR